MAVLSALDGDDDGTSQSDWCRFAYAVAGGDKVVSGLAVNFYSGRTVRVDAGQGVVGGIEFTVTASEDKTSTVNTSAQPRIDMLVARKLWPSLDVVLAVKEGAAAATPLMPALERNHAGVWEFGLAYWTVPGNSQPNIVGGLVARHNYEFAEVVTYDAATGNPSPTVGPGASVFLKATSFRVPSPLVKVSAEVWVDIECPVGQAAAGTVLIECNNQSWATPWKSVNGGSKQVAASLPRTVAPAAGSVQANVSVTAELLSQPITVSRFTTRLRQWT